MLYVFVHVLTLNADGLSRAQAEQDGMPMRVWARAVTMQKVSKVLVWTASDGGNTFHPSLAATIYYAKPSQPPRFVGNFDRQGFCCPKMLTKAFGLLHLNWDFCAQAKSRFS